MRAVARQWLLSKYLRALPGGAVPPCYNEKMMAKARLVQLLLGVLLLGAETTIANFTDCRFGFASLSPGDPEGTALAATTYRNLIDQLGRSLTPESIRKLKNGENPFHVPAQGTQVETLQRKMREFEELLIAHGWRTPELLAAIRSDLAVRLEGIDRGTKAIDQAVNRDWSDREWSMANPHQLAQSPDGRFLVSVEYGFSETDPFSFHLYDRQTKQLTKIPGGVGKGGQPTFSPDGKELRVQLNQTGYVVLPFESGRVDWASKRILPGMPGSVLVSTQVPSPHPDTFVGGNDSWPVHLVDVRNNTIVPLPLESILRNPGETHRPHNRAWGIVPGTDSYFSLYSDPTTKRTHFITWKVSATGALSRGQEMASFPDGDGIHTPDPSRVVFMPDGKRAFLYGGIYENRVIAYDHPGAAPRVVKEPPAGTTGDLKVIHAAAHPTKNELILLCEKRNSSPTVHWAEILDAQTHRVKAKIPLPVWAFRAQFSNDGESLIVGSVGGSTQSIYYERFIR